MKGMYHYISEAWNKPNIKDLRQRMLEWRKGNAIVRVEKPLRLDRARSLGYKAKPGFVVARVKLFRGGRKRPKRKGGRKGGGLTTRKTLMMNYREVAEQRAARKYRNLEVLNSYWIGEEGIYAFYEIIMIDPTHPQIKNDPSLKWIVSRRGRAFRGLTSAARKARGLRVFGKKRMMK
jgi:large subunit ribosomal protein L15e